MLVHCKCVYLIISGLKDYIGNLEDANHGCYLLDLLEYVFDNFWKGECHVICMLLY